MHNIVATWYYSICFPLSCMRALLINFELVCFALCYVTSLGFAVLRFVSPWLILARCKLLCFLSLLFVLPWLPWFALICPALSCVASLWITVRCFTLCTVLLCFLVRCLDLSCIAVVCLVLLRPAMSCSVLLCIDLHCFAAHPRHSVASGHCLVLLVCNVLRCFLMFSHALLGFFLLWLTSHCCICLLSALSLFCSELVCFDLPCVSSHCSASLCFPLCPSVLLWFAVNLFLPCFVLHSLASMPLVVPYCYLASHCITLRCFNVFCLAFFALSWSVYHWLVLFGSWCFVSICLAFHCFVLLRLLCDYLTFLRFVTYCVVPPCFALHNLAIIRCKLSNFTFFLRAFALSRIPCVVRCFVLPSSWHAWTCVASSHRDVAYLTLQQNVLPCFALPCVASPGFAVLWFDLRYFAGVVLLCSGLRCFALLCLPLSWLSQLLLALLWFVCFLHFAIHNLV